MQTQTYPSYQASAGQVSEPTSSTAARLVEEIQNLDGRISEIDMLLPKLCEERENARTALRMLTTNVCRDDVVNMTPKSVSR